MTWLLLAATLSTTPRAELLAMHRRDVAHWERHTPAEDRAWAETARPVGKAVGR